MRRQDELAALYPGRDAPTQKFVLSELDGLARAFDSEELLALLVQETGAASPLVRHQALFSCGAFVPSYFQKRYGLVPIQEGPWTRYARGADVPAAARDALEQARRTEARRCALLPLLEPLVAPLVALEAGGEPRLALLARRALARLPFPAVHDALEAAIARRGHSFEMLWSYALSGAGASRPDRLASYAMTQARHEPDALLALAALPAAALAEALPRALDARAGLARVNLAQVIARSWDRDPREPLRALFARPEAWVDVHALRALEALGTPDAMAEVEAVFARATSEFVRSQAVRAAGGLGGDRALAFCRAAARDAGELVRVRALESLVRMRCPPDALREAAGPLAASANPRVRANAVLATADPRERAMPAALAAMAASAAPLERLEAAYALGYWQTAAALRALAQSAARDPHELVRVQAVKSLSRFPARVAAPALLPLAAGRGATAAAAARVLARYAGAEAALVRNAVLERWPKCGDGERAHLAHVLGGAAADVADAGVDAALAAAAEHARPEVRAAALEALARRSAARVPLDALRDRAIAAGPPAVAARAILAAFAHGRVDGVGALVDLVRSRDAATAGAGLAAAAELATLCAAVLPAGRHAGLVQALEGRPAQPAAVVALFREPVRPEGAPLDEEELAVGAVEDIAEPAPQTSAPPVRGLDPPHFDPQAPGPGPRTPDPARAALRDASYLLAREADARLMAAELELAFLPPGLRRFAALVRVNRTLWVPPIALAVVAAVFALGAPATPVREFHLLPAVVLTAARVTGAVEETGTHEPLEPGAPVRLGQEASAATTASAAFVTPMGHRVEIAAGARLRVTALSTDGRTLEVQLGPAGRYHFDTRPRGRVVVRAAGAVLDAGDAALAVDDAGLDVEAGEVSVRGADRPLPPGRHRLSEILR